MCADAALPPVDRGVSTLERDSPSVVFVIGMGASDLGLIAEELRWLGLGVASESGGPDSSATSLREISRFNDQLLAELGAPEEKPALLPRLELLRRLQHMEAEGQRLFEATRRAFSDPRKDPLPWVWADPRNTILAPFWIKALDLSASVVLVHSHPARFASVLSRECDASFDDALVLWDEYNRLALSLWEEHSGVIVGIESFEDDPKAGVRGLQKYLEGIGLTVTEEQITAATVSFEGYGAPDEGTPSKDIPNKFLVLDRVLNGASLTTSVDHDAIVKEFANYYDEDYYIHYGNEGDAPYRQGEPQWTSFFSMVAERIDEDLHPESVLDAGCAIGFLVEALRERGVAAWGIDVSEWAISQVPESTKPYCSVVSLTEEINGHFDLVTLIEVIEHMPESVADGVVANIGRHAESVLFSSTADGFEEATHINVHTPDHWARLFALNGFYRDFDYDASYISKDAMLFRRGSPETGELIVGYEQSLWRTREHLHGILDEVVPERDALIAAVDEYAARTGLLEQENDRLSVEVRELGASLADIERRRVAESVATYEELVRRDRDSAGLHQELKRMQSDAAASAALVAAIESTKIFRYSTGLRRLYGRLRGWRDTEAAGAPHIVAEVADTPLNFSEWVARYDTLSDADRKVIRLRMNEIPEPPLISVVLPVFDTPEEFLREAVESVLNQLYPHWELCVVDDHSTEANVLETVDEYARLDSRIRVLRRDTNGHISAASNSALDMATGRWVALLDHDDRLREHALALVAIEAHRHPDAGLIYSDENVIDGGGRRLKDYFKPDFDPLLLLGMNHVGHLTVIRRDLVEQVGGFREGFEGSQDWDLILRITELLEQGQVRHIRHILYDWRSHSASTAQSLVAKPYAGEAGLRAVSEHVARQGDHATVVPIPALGWNRVKWKLPDPAPMVTIVIPTRDGQWLERCVQSIWTYTTYVNYEIVVIDNGSTASNTLEFLRRNEGRLRVLRDERPFSYSGLNNSAVERAHGAILCLLNDDTEVISPDWLDEMVGQVLRPKVGAVGAKLFYDNGTVQHAGVVLGIGGVGGHVHRGLDRLDIGYWGRAACAQHLSAVTGACMVVRREAWEQVSGLDDEHLSIGYNDVDFCLRLGEAGWRTVWTPFAEMTHHESVSRGSDLEGPNADRLGGEGRFMQQRWGDLLRDDPAYNPSLTLVYEDFSLACPPRIGLVGNGSIH